MKRVTKAVMNCNKKSATAVFTRGGEVKSAMTTNASSFPGTAIAVAAVGVDITQLGVLIGTSKGNSVIRGLRDALALKIYGELQLLLPPVNIAAAGSEAIIGLSGFASSADSSPIAIPNQVIIKKIVPGKEDLSAKILIESLKQSNLTYIVRTTTIAGAPINDPSWVTVLETSNSKKLILTGLVENQKIFIDMKAKNKRGIGMYSDAMAFSAHSA
jgi:hypothetical protein